MARRSIWIAAALVAAATGCAAMRATKERNQYLTTELDGLRYSKPMTEVWFQVRRMLAERGYPLAPGDAEVVGQSLDFLSGIFYRSKETRVEPLGGRSALFPDITARKDVSVDGPGKWWLETDWSDRAVRYRVEGTTDGTTCRVNFIAIAGNPNEKGHDGERRRDLEMELDFAWRVDPEAAGRIEAGLEALTGK
jgi:hypothetical protein